MISFEYHVFIFPLNIILICVSIFYNQLFVNEYYSLKGCSGHRKNIRNKLFWTPANCPKYGWDLSCPIQRPPTTITFRRACYNDRSGTCVWKFIQFDSTNRWRETGKKSVVATTRGGLNNPCYIYYSETKKTLLIGQDSLLVFKL